MKLTFQGTYQVSIDDVEGSTSNRKRVISIKDCDGKEIKFSTAEGKHKIYVVSCEGKPIYVGGTKQPFRRRLYTGLTAVGERGYSGYLWRNHCRQVSIDIWDICFNEQADFDCMKCDPSMLRAAGNKERQREILVETVEAEIVLLIQRRCGRWPKYQSEIHFHQSEQTHQDMAAKVVNLYPKLR